ncbi:MAG: 50S ribosomal protein L16 [Candidatus Melainabacteria bacterium]|nr:50S ribosomal protein L16 [Candidatus Melainabacteria bacterium]
MLLPKRSKFRKQQRGRMTGTETRGVSLEFGTVAMQAMEPAWITSRQIEASRRAMTRYIRRGGKIWIRIFPDKPVTKKPLEVRMGSGKGNPEFWVSLVKPGRVLFEIAGVQSSTAVKAMQLAAQKMPIKVRIICKENFPGGGYDESN